MLCSLINLKRLNSLKRDVVRSDGLCKDRQYVLASLRHVVLASAYSIHYRDQLSSPLVEVYLDKFLMNSRRVPWRNYCRGVGLDASIKPPR